MTGMHSRVTGRPVYRRLSRLLAYLAPAAAVGGTGAAYALGLETFAIVSLYATVPTLLAAGAYLAGSSASLSSGQRLSTHSTRRVKVTGALYLLALGSSLFVLSNHAVRPFVYYVLVGVALAVVAFQAFTADLDRRTVGVLLVEIATWLACLLWSVTLRYHYFFGRTDVFPHHAFVLDLLEAHHVTAAFGEYQAFPLWHVLVAFQTMLFDGALSPLTLFFVLTGVLFALGTAGAYALARRFRFCRAVSLAAAVGMCLHPLVVVYGQYGIPRSVTSFLFLFCLLLLLVDDARSSLLYLGLIVATAVYHTVSLPYVFVTVGVLYATERALALADGDAVPTDGYAVRLWQLLAIPVVQVGYWWVADPRLIERLVALVSTSSDYGVDAGGGFTSQFIESPVSELVNYLPFSVFVFFVLYALLRSAGVSVLSGRARSALLAGAVLTVLSFPGPGMLVSVVSNLTPDNVLRLAQYTYPVLVVGFGAGVVMAVRSPSPVDGRAARVLMAVLVLGAAGVLTASNDFVASDNPLVERDDFYTFYLSGPEVGSFETLTRRSSTTVTGDYVTCRYVDNPGGGDCEIIQANPLTGELFFPADSVFVLRTDELSDRPLSVYPTDAPVDEPPYSNNRESIGAESAVWSGVPLRNRVYDSQDVTAYTARGNTTGSRLRGPEDRARPVRRPYLVDRLLTGNSTLASE